MRSIQGSNKSAINISPPTIKYTSSWGYCFQQQGKNRRVQSTHLTPPHQSCWGRQVCLPEGNKHPLGGRPSPQPLIKDLQNSASLIPCNLCVLREFSLFVGAVKSENKYSVIQKIAQSSTELWLSEENSSVVACEVQCSA